MKDTPIIINNFNRLSSTRNMYEFLQRRNFSRIIILDNNSTYPPLLKWYDMLQTEVVRFTDNIGAHCLFDSGYLKSLNTEYIVYSDAFCLIRDPQEHALDALRIAGAFTARHLPWYQAYGSLNEEEKYFVEQATDQSNFRKGYYAWLNEQSQVTG